jgi:hypothetical protein
MAPSHDRQTFRETVALVAEKAKARLPAAVNGRIEAAARLVVNGDVAPLADGSITVGGSDPTRYYRLTGQACTCSDFVQGKAPDGWCKHRIAAGIHKRVQELLPAEPTPEVFGAGTKNQPLPEAPVSITMKATVYGFETLVTLRGTDFASVQAQVEHAAQWLKAPAPAPAPQATSPGEGWCSKHGIQMKLHTNAKGTWHSHYVDGKHCKGK